MKYLVDSGVNFKSYVKEAVEECKEIQKTHSCFTEILEEQALSQADIVQEKIISGKAGRLAGLLVTVKDNICMKEVESCACSDILRGYFPVEDATVLTLLKEQDAIIVARTTMDEFGFGSWSMNPGCSFPVPKNPHDSSRVAGGSSGGSAVATALLNFPHISIAESTGGSIENPASLCGVVGFCPTYGLFSRNGLIPYANSLDKIGLMAKKTELIEDVLSLLAKQDPKDPTSISASLEDPKESFRIGILPSGAEPEITKAFYDFTKKLKEKGFVVENSDAPLAYEYGVPTYYIIATAEASTNLASYCGLRYGVEAPPDGKSLREYFTSIRTKNLGKEAKRRVILGTFARMYGYREDYYLKATKVRTLIINEYNKLFEKFDILLTPTLTITAPTFEDVERLTPLETYNMDKLTVGPNLAGIPHISIPLGEAKGLPFGVMAMADHLSENSLLKFAKIVEEIR